MTPARYSIHPSRTCSSCDHDDPELGCLQLVSMADGSPRPSDFGCNEHQTKAEYTLGFHRFDRAPLGEAR